MVTSEKKSQAQMIDEGKKKTVGHVSSALTRNLERFRSAFNARMDPEVDAMFREVDVIRTVPPGSAVEIHSRLSRTVTDTVINGRMSDLLEKDYPSAIGKAFDRVALEADSRSWDEELVKKAVSAIGLDVGLHTMQMESLLEEAAWKLESPIRGHPIQNHEDAVLKAAMLENELRMIVNHGLEGHLFGIAREEHLKTLKRGDQGRSGPD